MTLYIPFPLRKDSAYHLAVFKFGFLYRLKFQYLLRDLRVLIGSYPKFW